ncbi:splicing factor U2af large subunit A protein [Rutstroemia sp. NJR-2017a WRK4]|nr:splicing factor U2af large subunit A protein [Rutstroemia sp. NJR-2017a WRK4]
MASANPTFIRLWRDTTIRNNILNHLDISSQCDFRLASSTCCDLITADLFLRTRLTFTPSALTRPSRIEALARIGPYIEHLIFYMPHSNATFLPPLLNPTTGREINFLYTPHTSMASVKERPKYGCPELGEILTQQYPPLFHAATNVPAFIKAMSHLPNLRHLTISCPNQDPAHRYRRNVVDYALISLRIAIERTHLPHLEKLSIHIHPSGLHYLRHMPGFGCTPSAGRRWRQIRKLNITMDSWDFLSLVPGRDHLKILDDYIRALAPNLEKIKFGWHGRKGPCPFSLSADPLFTPPKQTAKLFGEVTSPMSPLPPAPARAPIFFPKLRYMQVRNTTMSEHQVSEFVYKHRHTVKEFDFENTTLINGGTWENALAPLTRNSRSSDEWLSQPSGSDVDSLQYQSQGELYDIDEVVDTLFGLREPSIAGTKLKKKRVHRRRRRRHKDKEQEPKMEISAPIPIPELPMELLQPTVFDPNISGVQRDFQREEAQQELIDDPEKRMRALKKAREAVLKQLGKEFCKTQEKAQEKERPLKATCASATKKSRGFFGHESNTALVPLMFTHC